MRRWIIFALFPALLSGCLHPGTRIEREIGLNFTHYKRLGLLPISDPSGRGAALTRGVDAGLKGLAFQTADSAELESILGRHKPDRELGLSMEALTALRGKTKVDALIFGAMAADWSSVSITMLDSDLGEQVLRATVRPARKQRAFSGPEDAAAAIVRVFASTLNPKEDE